MKSFPEALYADLAARLLERIGAQNFFNGRVEVETQHAHYQLVTTLIAYRNGDRIVSIVPVWWELRCTESAGEVECDFSWDLLQRYF